MVLRSLYSPHMFVYMPDNVGAPNEMTDDVLVQRECLAFQLYGSNYTNPNELWKESSQLK